jgi:hypothetical protein
MREESWENTIQYLYDRRLHQFTASLLQAAGPLNLLGAQLIYVGEPILSLFISRDQTQRFAGILEDPVKIESFIRALRTYKTAS